MVKETQGVETMSNILCAEIADEAKVLGNVDLGNGSS